MRHSVPLLWLLLAGAVAIPAVSRQLWRSATEAELKEVIPARAPVENERIETETRTNSGITDGKGKFVAGSVLITAGYSAEGKYSHFLLTQVPLKVGESVLEPGNYVLSFKHEGDAVIIRIYRAGTGKLAATVEAQRMTRLGRIESFHIYPPSEHGVIAIGRFGFPYEIAAETHQH